MQKILIINPDLGHTCSFYRSGGIVKDLRKKLGNNFLIEVISWPEMRTDTWEQIYDYDIVMMQRPWLGSMVDFCERLKAMHIKLWLDYDDDFFAVTDENRAWPVFSDKVVRENVGKMLTMADMVTVTTPDLKKAYFDFNKNIVVIPNAFNDSIFDINRTLPERDDTILWRGSDTHVFDVMLYAPSIVKAMEERPEFEFTYMGYWPFFLGRHKNMKFQKALEVVPYFYAGLNLRPAAVQVPLNDTLFNRCKSNIAFIEAAFWGATSIIPEWWGKIPGTLQYTDQDSYYNALNSILAKEVDCVKLNDQAWQFVKDTLLLSKINKKRVEVIKTLL